MMHLLFAAALGRADVTVPDVRVTGTSAAAGDVAPATTELSGARLHARRRGTVGETLAREPGVTATDFGPNASRPVIRGLGGERVRVLQNGVGQMDASGASDDHAVAVDPLSLERIEVTRGPAALLYGPQAVGGVVNLTTARVPERVPSAVEGRFESRYGSTDDGRDAGVSVTAPAGASAAVHADLNARANEDYRVPTSRRILNSRARALSGAVGGSVIGARKFFGLAYSDYQSAYGTVAERFTVIDMRQRRLDVGAGWRDLGFVSELRVKNAFSIYAHDEVDAGETATRFRNNGDEARVDLAHRPVAGARGRFGAQASGTNFSARGEEGFMPETKTRAQGVFIFEERAAGQLRPSVGARVDLTRVASSTDADFGPGRARAFTGLSASLGLLYELTPVDHLLLNASFTERAPNYQELFARGPHGATRVYEVGDPDLGLEKSTAYELSWRRERARVNVFLQDFAGFVALVPTGDVVDDLPRFEHRATDARLFGAEAEWRQPLPVKLPGGRVELGLKSDLVHGEDRRTGRPLPRVTPIRESVSLEYKGDRFGAGTEVRRAERQTRVTTYETPTPAWVMVDFNFELPLSHAGVDGAAFARVTNAFNEEARNHVSLLKDVAPYAGRSFVAGVRGTF